MSQATVDFIFPIVLLISSFLTLGLILASII
jgi:hypothetical protein